MGVCLRLIVSTADHSYVSTPKKDGKKNRCRTCLLDSTVMALAGHVSRAMMERYSHIRMEAKRRAVDDLSGTDFEPGVAQNWAQFL
jgi:hypothetical protein